LKKNRSNVPIVGLISLSVLASRSSLLAKGSPMSPSAVLSADELRSHSVMETAALATAPDLGNRYAM